ncbi:MAG: arylsulfatase [Opitutaceae bacterium]
MPPERLTRRQMLERVGFAAVSAGAMSLLAAGKAEASPKPLPKPRGPRPNVVLIVIDDQGYGDLSCMGNPKLRTPNIDRLFEDSVSFPNHYGCPLCAPARASLMTGRYNYRTGVVDTSTGLAMMRPDETTLAQILSNDGYRTGIFSKWHLGDHYPLRPIDRGFQESLICKDAIVAGIANAPNNSLFDPILYHNGKPVKTHGYITDISFNAAMEFIEGRREEPFFVYLATNVVHSPLEVAPHYSDPFKAMGLDDYTATLYGEMVNLDENVGRLRSRLQQLGLAENTIVIYTVDNGPIGPHGVDEGPIGPYRYNAGLRGGKGTVFEGGIRLPLSIAWPGKIGGGRKCRRIVSHIDMLPTLLEMCGVDKPGKVRLDGKSLVPLMEGHEAEWPERTLFFQQSRPDRVHRLYSDEPRLYVSCAARGQKYKILMSAPGWNHRYFQPVDLEHTELYDIENDPGETRNIARDHPQIVRRMRNEFRAWFEDVTGGVGPPVRNVLGTRHENPVKLCAQDLRGPRSALGPHELRDAHAQAEKREPHGFGYWAVEVARGGRYRITMQFVPPPVLDAVCPWQFPLKKGEAFLRIGDLAVDRLIPEGAGSVVFDVELGPGRHFLDASFTGQREIPIEVSPFFVNVECLGIAAT